MARSNPLIANLSSECWMGEKSNQINTLEATEEGACLVPSLKEPVVGQQKANS